MWSTSQATQVDSNTNTGALISETKLPQNLTRRKKMIYIYCSGEHWSDECQTFSTVTARKEKIKGHCFICLKQSHLHWGEKNCTVKKACVYRKQRNRHHRSLCIKRFPDEKSSEMRNPYLLLLLQIIPCCPLKNKCWCKLPLLKKKIAKN